MNVNLVRFFDVYLSRHYVAVGVVLGSAAAFAVAFIWIYPSLGPALAPIAVLPVAVAAWLLGLRLGLLAGLIMIPLVGLLSALLAEPSKFTALETLPLGITMLVVSTITGLLKELLSEAKQHSEALASESQMLRVEIDDRRSAEKEKHALQEALEARILQRTAELTRANRELEFLGHAAQAFSSTLDLDQVLASVLDQACQLLRVDAAAVWLMEAHLGAQEEGFNDLVCHQAVGPNHEAVRGWRLKSGEGVAGWVAQQGKSFIVHDATLNPRHVKEVGLRAGLELRSILCVPMQSSCRGSPRGTKQDVIGVLQVADTAANRFEDSDLLPLESLAASAAFAIENARLYEQAHQEISERRRAEEALKRYAAQLEQSNKELQDFLSITSHDLQEPLRKVRAFGNRLQTDYAVALDDQGQDFLVRMQNAAARMQDLIAALSAYTRVTTGAQSFRPVDLGRVAYQVVCDLAKQIEQERGRVEVIGSLPTIDADPVQMYQLLGNLVDNALKFHRKDQPPVVKVQAQFFNGKGEFPLEDTSAATSCRITVEDNGIGFDEKYLDRIFQVFQRLHNRNEYEGTGMGLAICRKIAERHSGNISARSTQGQGAAFFVTLPIRQSTGEEYDE